MSFKTFDRSGKHGNPPLNQYSLTLIPLYSPNLLAIDHMINLSIH